jgi:hypothetical protein
MRRTLYRERESVAEIESQTGRARLQVTSEEACEIANLLRYVVSLNTTAGLISPTERRLATPTYRAVELAALILEGKSFEEATREAEAAWTGSLQEDHRRALEVMQTTRDALQSAISGQMAPEQLADYLEISQQQLIELIKPGMLQPAKIPEK